VRAQPLLRLDTPSAFAAFVRVRIGLMMTDVDVPGEDD